MKTGIWIIIVLIVVVAIGAAVAYTTRTDEVTETRESGEGGEAENAMTFFVTSRNPGTGADFGGLSGADQHCQALADEAGAGNAVWRAYLSAGPTDSEEAIHARDRIGNGPWHNAEGILIAASIEELHSDNAITKETALDETGALVNGRGDTPNRHDILTGSTAEGMFSESENDTTCSNWTSDREGSAIVGHHDRVGLDDSEAARSWNSSHGSRGCSLENLNGTGGDGLLYCFATTE